jgi:large subunit ribosomal protein LP2
MKYLASYLLLQQGGNASPSAADIKALLETVGIEAEQERLDKLISELEGKDINEVSHLWRLVWERGLEWAG